MLKQSNVPRQTINWSPPPTNKVKWNVDESPRGNSGAPRIGKCLEMTMA